MGADGHLRGVEVEPEPDHIDRRGKALVRCEGDAQLGTDVEEGIKGPADVKVAALAPDEIINLDERVVPMLGPDPSDLRHHAHTGGARDAAAEGQGDVDVGGIVKGDAKERHRQGFGAKLVIGSHDVGSPHVGTDARVDEAPAEVSGGRTGV